LPARAGREIDWPKLGVAGLVVLAAFAWAYWPTLVNLVSAWDREPDYSHGYFVLPLALFFLYARRDTFPGLKLGLAWPGLVLIAMSIGVRMFGARYYVDPIDGWSILFWVAGVVWLLGGWRVFWWSAPSIAFLWFMIPLPWRVERWLSLPLQRIATKISCWGLQCLGQPALAEGNTILIEDFHIEVEQACSGLRIFVGIVALAFAYIILVRRPWWERALLLLSVVPIAIIANSTRIIATALLNQYVSGEAAHTFTHDISGYVMIPFAAGLFALLLWYLSSLVREVEFADIGDVVRGEDF
jgi:exosortase